MADEKLVDVSISIERELFVSDPVMTAGSLGNSMRVLFPVLLLPKAFSSNYFPFANSNVTFFPNNLAISTL